MRICVTSSGKDQDSPVDPRFGRCKVFVFADTETEGIEAVENPGIADSGGAGTRAGQLMVSKKVEAVLTGAVGPNAERVLSAAGIRVQTGVSGTVRQAIEGFKSGKTGPGA